MKLQHGWIAGIRRWSGWPGGSGGPCQDWRARSGDASDPETAACWTVPAQHSQTCARDVSATWASCGPRSMSGRAPCTGLGRPSAPRWALNVSVQKPLLEDMTRRIKSKRFGLLCTGAGQPSDPRWATLMSGKPCRALCKAEGSHSAQAWLLMVPMKATCASPCDGLDLCFSCQGIQQL